MKAKIIILLAVVAAVLLVGLLVLSSSLSARYPKWNCRTDEISIKTGEARHRRYFLFVKVSEGIVDTPLSKALGGPVDRSEIEAWHTVNTFAPPFARVSPHYRFHSALGQAHEVGILFEMLDLSPQRRREIAEKVLTRWQAEGGDHGVDEYLEELVKEGLPSQP